MREENSEIQDYDYNRDLEDAYGNTNPASSAITETLETAANVDNNTVAETAVQQERDTFQPQQVNFGTTDETTEEIGPGSYSSAVLGGVIGMVGCTVLWTLITVITNYQIGYMAIGVGFAVGFLVQRMGKGRGMDFGIIGALFSLLACIFGNLFSNIHFIASEFEVSYGTVLSSFTPGLYVDLMVESFHPMDVLFYGIALYTGFKMAYNGKN